MDPDIGDLSPGDVLIDGDRIAQVSRSIDVDDAEKIDVTGHILRS